MLRETEPEKIKARRDKAVEGFEDGKDKPAEETEAAASPWVSSAPAVMPKEALPSALAPVGVAGPGVVGAAPGTKKKLPRWAPSVAAVLAVVVPLVALWLTMRPKGPAPEGARVGPAGSAFSPATSSSSIEERAAGSAGPAGSAAAAPSVVPSAVPAASAATPEPSVSASARAEPKQKVLPKKAAAKDAGTAGNQDPGLNE